ncbi:YtxH domain-containing protein [Promicromonospora sp. NPDC023805]|uniref:YtxH domain-containing protein n=1 Tax=Promicromonospora sp. NPDC023805 TaxID=3154696 RepID=UPI0033F707D0
MSGNMYGADIEALRQLADRITRGGEVLDGAVRAVESAMPVPEQWSGPDAESFRDEWYGSHGPSIAASAQALAAVVDTLRRNADEQETTSANLNGGSGGGGVGGGGGGGGGGSWGGESDWRSSVPDLPDSIRKLVDSLGLSATIGGLGADAMRWMDPFKAAGPIFTAVSLVTGGYQAIDSGLDFLREGGSDNLYGAGDGAVEAVLAGGTFFGGLAAPAFAIGGIFWGVASLVNDRTSHRPLTQNLVDTSAVGLLYNSSSDTELSEDIADVADSAVDSAGELVGDVVDAGGDLVDGAGDLLGLW